MSSGERVITLGELLQLLSSDLKKSSRKSVSQRLGNYVMVAAIDFGTTFSGYAFSFKKDQKDIKMNKNWGAAAGFNSYKTPTCVLLDPQGKFKAFGYEAQSMYAELTEGDDQTYAYFDKFKMTLHNNKTLDKSTTIKATNGKSHSALRIFAMALEFLKKHLTDLVSQQMEGSIDTKLIRWVVTVPAIWSDASKQFMREAAFEAGLVDEKDSTQLVIALEPEAASLFARQLDINKFVTRQNSSTSKLSPGSKYLVIDAGGGTLDVTAHELLPGERVKELHHATGGALGGTRVDGKFAELMAAIFGQDFISKYKQKHASQWLALMADFERKKRTSSQAASTNIQLLYGFGTAFREMKGQNVDVAIKNYKGTGVKFNNGMLCLSEDVMQSLFKDVIDGIVKHVQDLMTKPKLHDIKYFFLVGGFSESSRIQDAICSKFGRSVKVMIPEESSLAVVKGAVMFGHNPSVIQSRISARTYGVESTTDFDPSKHPLEKKVDYEGRVKCKDIFVIFIKSGEEVEDGETKSLVFRPTRHDQDGAAVEIYSSENPNVKYTTDDDADCHGRIHVDWPGSGLERKLEVSMTFGGTEIYVEAMTHPGNNKADTKLDFLTRN